MDIIYILEPYFVHTIILLFIFSGTLISIYFKERVKLKAIKAENEKLISQTESIKSKFNKELEELKKEHQLDITKRKYQYESKKETYYNFFKLLDQFTRENNVKNQEVLLSTLDDFNRNYISAVNKNNKKGETNAITIFSKKIQKLTLDSNQDLIKMKQETNIVRLIASKEILNKLDLLNRAYDQSMEISNKTMNSLPSLVLTKNQTQIEINQKKVESSALQINYIKDEIIELMRNELNEI